jgi:hypothetical protein
MWQLWPSFRRGRMCRRYLVPFAILFRAFSSMCMQKIRHIQLKFIFHSHWPMCPPHIGQCKWKTSFCSTCPIFCMFVDHNSLIKIANGTNPLRPLLLSIMGVMHNLHVHLSYRMKCFLYISQLIFGIFEQLRSLQKGNNVPLYLKSDAFKIWHSNVRKLKITLNSIILGYCEFFNFLRIIWK